MSANGTPIQEYGKAVFNITLGDIRLCKELIVAEIEDDGLLGMDVLQRDTADILMSKGIIKLRRQTVPCISTGTWIRSRKVTVAYDYVFPAESESIIDVFIERDEGDELREANEFIIEPSQNFKSAYPLQMAATLVDNSPCVTCKVRLLNPFSTPVSLKQNAVFGVAEPIREPIVTLIHKEDVTQEGDNTSVRRIRIESHTTGGTEQVQKLSHPTEKRDIPEHLSGLIKHASKNLTPSEREDLVNLLN